MRLSIGLISSCLRSAWIAFIRALIVAASRSSSVGVSTDIGCLTVHPYIVNGCSRFLRSYRIYCNSFRGLPCFHPVVNFPDVSPKVSCFDKLFHQILQASVSVDLIP